MVVEQRHSLGAATPSVTPEIEPCDDSDDHERWHEEPMESDLMTFESVPRAGAIQYCVRAAWRAAARAAILAWVQSARWAEL